MNNFIRNISTDENLNISLSQFKVQRDNTASISSQQWLKLTRNTRGLSLLAPVQAVGRSARKMLTPGSYLLVNSQAKKVSDSSSGAKKSTPVQVDVLSSMANGDNSFLMSQPQSSGSRPSSDAPVIPSNSTLSSSDPHSSLHSNTSSEEAAKSNRPKIYRTKHRKITEKMNVKVKKTNLYKKAIKEFEAGRFKSLRKCSTFHNVPISTLHRLLKTGDTFKGSGKTLGCLSYDEEMTIINHVKWRSKIGCGVDFSQLESLVQESLLALKSANPDRQTGYEETRQRPERSFVRRMVERHNMTLRRTGEISKGNF